MLIMRKIFGFFALSLLFIALAALFIPLIDFEPKVSHSSDIFDLVSPELIKFYEDNFSKEPVISSVKGKKMEKMTEAYGAGENKIKVLIMINDLSTRNGDPVSMKELSQMSTPELFKVAKKNFEIYLNGISEEEKAKITENFNKLKESGKIPDIPFIKVGLSDNVLKAMVYTGEEEDKKDDGEYHICVKDKGDKNIQKGDEGKDNKQGEDGGSQGEDGGSQNDERPHYPDTPIRPCPRPRPPFFPRKDKQ